MIMIKSILLSQLVGMISATWETNSVKARRGGVNYKNVQAFLNDKFAQVSLVISWKNQIHCGQSKQNLYLSFGRVELGNREYNQNSDAKFVFHAFYYDGDNCNESTRFLYEIMGNEIDVVDDLGLIITPLKLDENLCKRKASKVKKYICWLDRPENVERPENFN